MNPPKVRGGLVTPNLSYHALGTALTAFMTTSLTESRTLQTSPS